MFYLPSKTGGGQSQRIVLEELLDMFNSGLFWSSSVYFGSLMEKKKSIWALSALPVNFNLSVQNLDFEHDRKAGEDQTSV